MRKLQIALFSLTILISSGIAAPNLPKRIVFIGDSNTNAGQFISYIDAAFRMRGVKNGPELINLGLSSETCTGLTEPEHPFPRPDVHERLARVLEKTKPDAVVAGYGMNDGIYHPFSEERFAAFQKGIQGIIDACKKANVQLRLLTPPNFDPQPMGKKGQLLPAGAENYSWKAIYETYDEDVMGRYGEWMLTLKDVPVYDIRTPMNTYQAEKRKTDPDFAMSGDGVHFDQEGHRIVADALLEAWGFGKNATSVVSDEIFNATHSRQMVLHNAWLSHVGHKRPGVKAGLPLEEAEAKAAEMEEELNHQVALAILDAATKKAVAAGAEFDRKILVAKFPAGEKPESLFNGKNLDGWDGWDKYWSVTDGMIRGANGEGVGVPSSTYLFSKKSYRNFRLILDVKQTMSPKHSTMHSAVGALGERFADKGDNAHGFKGPLLMFCHDWGIWDAYRRNRVVPAEQKGPVDSAAWEKKGDWNRVEFLVTGNRIRCASNGVEVFDFTDKPEMLQASPIGLQLHSNGKPQEYHFRNILISENPAADATLMTVGKK